MPHKNPFKSEHDNDMSNSNLTRTVEILGDEMEK